MNRNVLLLVLSIVSFILAAIAGESDTGEVLLAAVTWLGLGGALFAAAHLP